MTLNGVYFGGKSSRGSAVLVEWQGDTLLISGKEIADQAAKINDVSIEPRLAGMARHLKLPNGAILEMADTDELEAWFRNVGMIERAADWLERRWPIAIGSLMISAIAAWAIYAFVIPGTANIIAYNMPQNWQNKISSGSLTLMRQLGITDSQVPLERQKEIRKAFTPLVTKLPNSGRYQLEFRKSGPLGANAFALPGGRMVVLDGLVKLTDNDEEIIAVLAHELGHAYNRHALRNMIQSSFIATLVTIAVGDISGLATLPLIGLQAAHTRQFEREADSFAISALKEADISPSALARMFEKLRDDAEMSGNEGGLLATHPSLNERIMKAKSAAGILSDAAAQQEEDSAH